MEQIVNTSLYNAIMDLGGIGLTILFTTWFCYYLWKGKKSMSKRTINTSLIINDDDLAVDSSSNPR